MAEPLRVGVLQFGTVLWELDVIDRHGLARKEGIELEVVGLTNKTATAVALQSGDVDIIVTDWIWVSRQRAEGAPYTFVPYSTAAGAVLVPQDSKLAKITGLSGKRLGIAGGPLDKGWLLLRALASREAGLDLDQGVDKVFGAAPLLAHEALSGQLDAVLNFWHYTARLRAAGMRKLITVPEITGRLGIESEIPLIGYVFDETWAAARKADVLAFFRASQAAREILAASESEWDALRPLMKVDDDPTFLALQDGYRNGIPRAWGEREREDAKRLFAILAEVGGRELVGRSEQLQDGTFWSNIRY